GLTQMAKQIKAGTVRMNRLFSCPLKRRRFRMAADRSAVASSSEISPLVRIESALERENHAPDRHPLRRLTRQAGWAGSELKSGVIREVQMHLRHQQIAPARCDFIVQFDAQRHAIGDTVEPARIDDTCQFIAPIDTGPSEPRHV